jgi:VWFA-related protein
MRNKIRPAAVIILVVAFVAIGVSQQTLVVDVNLTLLTVRVLDRQGMPAPYLTAKDFEILEEGQHRPVSHFFNQTQPVSVGLLIDRSISVRTGRDAAFRNVVRICNALSPIDQTFLMTFSTGSKMDVSFTHDHTSIISAAHRMKPTAGTRFYDAMIDALDELSRNSAGSKALIALTDGADHYSTHTFQQLLDVAGSYGSEIDIIAVLGDDSRTWSATGRAEISAELHELVRRTGGRLVSSSNEDETAAAIGRMVDDLHNVYEIGFYSSEPFSESPHIEIRIRNRPELTVFPVVPHPRFEK